MSELERNKVQVYIAVAIAITFIAFFVMYGQKICEPQRGSGKPTETKQIIESNNSVEQNQSLFIGCNGFF